MPQTASAQALLTAVARLHRLAASFEEVQIAPAQSRVLLLLEEAQPQRISELARIDHCSQPTMTSQVKRLEANGWVLREIDPHDHRATLVSLTQGGHDLLEEIRVQRSHVLTPIVEAMADNQRAEIERTTQTLLELIERLERSKFPHA